MWWRKKEKKSNSTDLQNNSSHINTSNQHVSSRPSDWRDRYALIIATGIWIEAHKYLIKVGIPKNLRNQTLFWTVFYFSIIDILEANNMVSFVEDSFQSYLRRYGARAAIPSDEIEHRIAYQELVLEYLEFSALDPKSQDDLCAILKYAINETSGTDEADRPLDAINLLEFLNSIYVITDNTIKLFAS